MIQSLGYAIRIRFAKTMTGSSKTIKLYIAVVSMRITSPSASLTRYADTYDDLDGGPLAKLLEIEDARVYL